MTLGQGHFRTGEAGTSVALDVPTLLVVTVFISTMAGILLLFSWLQNRNVDALLCWGCAYLTGAVATALLGARGNISDFWSIVVATALLQGAAGLTFSGLRIFEGRPTAAWHTLAGSLVWLFACSFGEFYHSLIARIALGSVVLAVYSTLCVRELWTARADGLMSRWPTMGLFAFHGAIYLARIPLAAMATLPPGAGLFQMKWLAFGIIEALFYAFGTAFLLLTMAKEKVESRHRRAAFIDPLTEVPNRRGFVVNAEEVLAQCRATDRAATLLMFDLDHFKAINDTFGHQVGDEILVGFCRAASAHLGPIDLFARVGGEEFAALLPGVSPREAMAIAERIRRDFDAADWTIRERHVHATVSIGMASSLEAGHDLRGLMAAADTALYRAKSKGRNRVESPRAPLALVPTIAAG